MSIKKLFLAHHSKYREELHYIAAELRLRGVVPWVDKDGGFEVADECEPEARRAIREDCYGLMLYATKSAFGRWFIKNVELDEARKVHDSAKTAGTEFDFFAVPRGIGYRYLGTKSKEVAGMNLADMNTVSIPPGVGLGPWLHKQPADIERARERFAEKAATLGSEVAKRVIRRAAETGGTSRLSLQYRTRQEIMPDKPDDSLFINAAPLLAANIQDERQWARLTRGLLDVRGHIAHYYGRPRIHVHGSKHTTAAFLFGRVFARYELEIQQTPTEIWASDAPFTEAEPFSVNVVEGLRQGGPLFLEVAVGHKNIAEGVDAFIAKSGVEPTARLQLRPADGPLDVDNGLCRALVRQTYTEIERAVQKHSPAEIHLFIAAHQSYTMLLGREFRGMPPVHVYEWDGTGYVHAYCVPSDI